MPAQSETQQPYTDDGERENPEQMPDIGSDPTELPQESPTDPPRSRIGDNTEKNPDEWTTGDEPMTGAQRSYLKTLSDEAGEQFDENLTKAQASKRIDDLQNKGGQGG